MFLKFSTTIPNSLTIHIHPFLSVLKHWKNMVSYTHEHEVTWRIILDIFFHIMKHVYIRGISLLDRMPCGNTLIGGFLS